jgi:hypothetical protein
VRASISPTPPPPNPGRWFWGGAEAVVHEDCTPPPRSGRLAGTGGREAVAGPRCVRSAIGLWLSIGFLGFLRLANCLLTGDFHSRFRPVASSP